MGTIICSRTEGSERKREVLYTHKFEKLTKTEPPETSAPDLEQKKKTNATKHKIFDPTNLRMVSDCKRELNFP